MKTAIQLFTIQDLHTPLPQIIDAVDGTAFDGIELATIPDNPKAAREAIESSDVSIAGMHVRSDTLESELGSVVAACETLDCDTVVIPYLNDSHFESEAAVRETATYLSNRGDRLADHGLRLLYHNHGNEFTDLGGKTAFDRLIEETNRNVGYELDIGWTSSEDIDPLAILERLDGRCPMVHVRDMNHDTHTSVELGDGDVDVFECVQAARNAGCEWVVYEHDHPDSAADSLEIGGRTLLDMVERAGG